MSLSPDQKLAAYFLGRRIAGQRRKQDRVPVAYLYNGVRLPGLPEWDKEMYPFAYIGRNSSGTCYLWCDDEVKIASVDGQILFLSALGFVAKDGKWESSTAAGVGATIVWSNVDVYDVDGTLYLTASEPVPVYE